MRWFIALIMGAALLLPLAVIAQDAPFEVVTDEVFCALILDAGVIPESMYPTHEDYMVVFATEQAETEDHNH